MRGSVGWTSEAPSASLRTIGRSDVARVDAGLDERLEALGHGLRRQRCCSRARARPCAPSPWRARRGGTTPDHSAMVRPSWVMRAAREGEAARHLQRLAARFERRADAARAQELDGDAHRHGEGGVGAAVGGAAGHQAERVVGEGQDARRHARRPRSCRGAAWVGSTQCTVPAFRASPWRSEVERADMILERIGRHEDGVAARLMSGWCRALALVKRRWRVLIGEITRIDKEPRSETSWRQPPTRSTSPGIAARPAWWPIVVFDNARRLNVAQPAGAARSHRGVPRAVAREDDLRVVVFSGAGGRAFIGGADINHMAAMRTSEDGRAFITLVHKLCQSIRDCPVPVICRIEGYTLGAGLEVAAACDMRIAADNAAFRHARGEGRHSLGRRGGAAAAPDRLGPHLVAAAHGREHRRRQGRGLGPGRAGRAGGEDRRGGRALRAFDRRRRRRWRCGRRSA